MAHYDNFFHTPALLFGSSSDDINLDKISKKQSHTCMGFDLGTFRSRCSGLNQYTTGVQTLSHSTKICSLKTQGCATQTCTKPSNVHFGHAICHKNVSIRHAIIQAVAHVGHENRKLISMTDMQYDWQCPFRTCNMSQKCIKQTCNNTRCSSCWS